jgi:hypothetical protein
MRKKVIALLEPLPATRSVYTAALLAAWIVGYVSCLSAKNHFWIVNRIRCIPRFPRRQRAQRATQNEEVAKSSDIDPMIDEEEPNFNDSEEYVDDITDEGNLSLR